MICYVCSQVRYLEQTCKGRDESSHGTFSPDTACPGHAKRTHILSVVQVSFILSPTNIHHILRFIQKVPNVFSEANSREDADPARMSRQYYTHVALRELVLCLSFRYEQPCGCDDRSWVCWGRWGCTSVCASTSASTSAPLSRAARGGCGSAGV